MITQPDHLKKLRTHLWHAKLFTMTKLWGFYLPFGVHGSGRGSRALFKLLQCCAVGGTRVRILLLSILKTVLVSSPYSLCEDARNGILSGAIYGSAELHHVGPTFSQTIAPVTYMWQPLQCRNADMKVDNANICGEQQKVDGCVSLRRLRIWIHAAAFSEGYKALQNSCERWSIILPLSWIKVFWISLVTNGAQAIGLREKHWISCDLGLPCFPREFPDCKAYSCFMALEEVAYDEKSELRSPHTRTWKVPVSSPWDSVRLALEGLRGAGHGRIQHETNFSKRAPFDGFVARMSGVLTQFLDEINGSHLLLFPKMLHRKKCISKFIKDERILNKDTYRIIYQINRDQKLCLVRFLLHAYREGSFEQGAVVCAPQTDDIMLFTTRSEISKGELQVPESFARSCFSQQETGKWELQVPEDHAAKESYRLPIGFITTGFVRGSKKPVAVALCEAVCLARLREEQWKAVGVRKRRKEIYVLVRNLRSTAYRLALASIVLEQWEDDVECM
ncbi:hypothetical protein K7X08_004801 [Anisodus acutangulus]|uniref:Uncharacterized protein n=1 Tax=Anisodus acutangulus TaxID=402998 RepID=A0A9Q1ME41_9SOLA|nr:hypothetical protein K7X08_004801 [Anisodus acutangulus]